MGLQPITKYIVLDISKNKYVSVPVNQYDKNIQNIVVTITDYGKPYLVDSTIVPRIKGKKADDNNVLNNCTVLEDGRINIEIKPQMTVAYGLGVYELVLFDTTNNKVLHTMDFILNVKKGVFQNDEEIISTDDFSALEEALLKVDGLDAETVKQTIATMEQSLSEHLEDTNNPHKVTKSQVGLGNVDNTSDLNKPVSTIQQTAIDLAESNAKAYTDTEIANLINGAPTTLDTLKEIADAMAENEDVVNALDEAIGSKASKDELDTHIDDDSVHTTQEEKDKLASIEDNANNYSLPTASDSILGGVKIGDNITNTKGILSLTKDNVVNALGYEPGTGTSSDTSTIDVTSYGVVSGASAEENTPKILECLDYCLENECIMQFPAGIFYINEPLIITKGISIRGVGKDLTILHFEPKAELTEENRNTDEEDAFIKVRSNNVNIQSLKIRGTDIEDITTASNYNGIIQHYKDENGEYKWYQKLTLFDVAIWGFYNGIFIFGGWNRNIQSCQFYINKHAGIQYDLLGDNTDWVASGDILMGCDFLVNGIGYLANFNFQSTIWNCVFEYNTPAIRVTNCNDITFKNCWNEANNGNIEVVGSAKFEGGYNISPSTITHTATSSNSTCVIEEANKTTIISGEEERFTQIAGIITKGVQIAANYSNIIPNPEFTNFTDWNRYESYIFSLDESKLYDNKPTLKCSSTRQAVEQYWVCRTIPIAVTNNTSYTIEFKTLIETAGNIDSGADFWVQYQYANNDQISTENFSINSYVAENTWEDRTFTFTTPSECAYVSVGFTIVKNGTYWIASPMLYNSNELENTNIILRTNEDNDQINIFDTSGNMLNSIDLNIQEQVDSFGQFPTPTNADNGKFLRVVDGKIAMVNILNGNEVSY